ncbi:RNA polymerase sigma factor for flagellar operon FliA [Paucimonas lemoignei]|uniref:RNA polymerase sigma factor for flagellar operon FliA n=1 Tax=Paucimonas lemoignei TaxID=29443 RepID=A0A4R3HYI0_PAULE|nr:sigma-70 family RNA polymerase sigma factor [Paucimonas lemoignei]TCS37733.1 RNA polymerase sigma factor for flagellar operon FliA [Paucimonas lemoignei]
MPAGRAKIDGDKNVAAFQATEKELWLQFASTKDAAVRLQLIDLYLPFARMLAAKLYGRRQGLEAPFDDYLHTASVALIQAIDRYDSALGASFQTFAQYRIEGAILNELPKLSEQHAQISMLSRLRKERIESITEKRATEKSKAKETLFDDMVELAVGLSIGYMLEGSGMYCDDTETDERDGYTVHAVKQLEGLLQKLVDLLPEKEKAVIKYHYFFGLGMEEIGTRMQLSKGRISQLHKQALKSLKGMADTVHLNLSL